MDTRSFFNRRRAVRLAACLAALGSTTVARAEGGVRLPLDTATTVSGVEVACTGIGQTKDNPKWQAYPVRLEFSDTTGAYVSDETLTVAAGRGGSPLLAVSCSAPWVLMKLPPGRDYHVTASLTGNGAPTRSAVVKAPEHGQARFVFAFPSTN